MDCFGSRDVDHEVYCDFGWLSLEKIHLLCPNTAVLPYVSARSLKYYAREGTIFLSFFCCSTSSKANDYTFPQTIQSCYPWSIALQWSRPSGTTDPDLHLLIPTNFWLYEQKMSSCAFWSCGEGCFFVRIRRRVRKDYCGRCDYCYRAFK